MLAMPRNHTRGRVHFCMDVLGKLTNRVADVLDLKREFYCDPRA